MTRQAIDTVTLQANGKRGEPAKGAFEKINSMTTEIYNRLSQLGTAANANIGTGQYQVMTVPAFGLGKREDVGNTSIMGSMNYWGTAFGVIADGTQYQPVAYGTCLNMTFPGGNYLGSQLYMGTSPGGFIGFRSGDFSGAQPGGSFNTIYHTGNTTRAADGTLKAI